MDKEPTFYLGVPMVVQKGGVTVKTPYSSHWFQSMASARKFIRDMRREARAFVCDNPEASWIEDVKAGVA